MVGLYDCSQDIEQIRRRYVAQYHYWAYVDGDLGLDSMPPAQLPFGLYDLNINISVDGTETKGRRWDTHGASWCRLAVIPPVDVLRVNILHTYCIVKNEDGVTVWDVLDAVRTW